MKKSIKDSYFDDSQLAMTYSSQARVEAGRLEEVLNKLAWARHEMEKLVAGYKPMKRAAMNTYDPSVDDSDPVEHLEILKRNMRQVRGNLAGLVRDVNQLLERYRDLLAE